jgi:hypothetical protein
MQDLMRSFVCVCCVVSLLCIGYACKNRGDIHYPIPSQVIDQMKLYSWRAGCPVPVKDLAYLRIPYWGFNGQPREGEMIVHKDVAREVASLFKTFHARKFPIEKMQLIDSYKGSDDASMNDNNTSAFNCRSVTGKPGEYSRHSYGKAIDINPLTNPYVKNTHVLPKAGAKYTDRTTSHQGMIKKADLVYRAFVDKGWQWGGNWKSLKDYQHFEKH